MAIIKEIKKFTESIIGFLAHCEKFNTDRYILFSDSMYLDREVFMEMNPPQIVFPLKKWERKLVTKELLGVLFREEYLYNMSEEMKDMIKKGGNKIREEFIEYGVSVSDDAILIEYSPGTRTYLNPEWENTYKIIYNAIINGDCI